MTPHFEDPLVTLYFGDCLDVMRELPDASVDSVVTDPPYLLGFMGKVWDAEPKSFVERKSRRRAGSFEAEHGNHNPTDAADAARTRAVENRRGEEFHYKWATEAFRVLKPGGYLLAFGGTRTYHRLASAIEDAGFEIRDTLQWVYASGFAKSRRLELDPRFCQCAAESASSARSDANTGHTPDEDGHTSTARASASHGRGVPSPSAPSGKRRGQGSPGGYQLDHGFDDGQPLPAEADALAPAPSPADAPARSRSTAQGDDQMEPGPSHSRSSGGHTARPSMQDSPAPDSSPLATPPDRQPSTAGSRPSTGMDTAGSPARISGTGTSLSAWPHCTACGKPKGNGYGSALKPAHEPIVMARKPLVGNLATNVLRYGTGALNIDGTRIAADYAAEYGETWLRSGKQAKPDDQWQGPGEKAPGSTVADRVNAAGRWPSNVLLSDPELFDEPNPYVVGSGATTTDGVAVKRNLDGEYPDQPTSWALRQQQTDDVTYGGGGGYSRFFLIPKADRAERERGLRGENGARGNTHPTVKSLDLMRHLVRLVTPPGGVTLDPFLGSGTTALAASEEGFRCIGIEREAEYLDIAVGRLMATPMGLGLETELRQRAPKTGRGDGKDWSEGPVHGQDGVTNFVNKKPTGKHYADGPGRPPKLPKPTAPTEPMWSDEEPAA